jgi:hypothetical protein
MTWMHRSQFMSFMLPQSCHGYNISAQDDLLLFWDGTYMRSKKKKFPTNCAVAGKLWEWGGGGALGVV